MVALAISKAWSSDNKGGHGQWPLVLINYRSPQFILLQNLQIKSKSSAFGRFIHLLLAILAMYDSTYFHAS